MVSSTNPGISYEYDGHKRRVQKTEGSQTSYSVYSPTGKLMHKKVGGVTTDYIYAGSMLVAEKTGATVDYMYTDLLGSPIAGNNGSTYKEHYRPWGEKKDHPLQLADDVGYTGHQDDVATGLTYMQARYYDPVIGRFMATDPVGFTAGNPKSFGRYTYANGNPYKFADPDGRQSAPFRSYPTRDQLIRAGLSREQVGSAMASVNAAIGVEAVGAMTIAAAVSPIDETVAAVKLGQMAFGGLRAASASIRIAKAVPTEASKEITKSSRKRVKRLVKNLSDNSRQNNGLSQEKADQLSRIVEKAGGKLRNDGVSGVKGSSAGRPHVQTEGLGKSIDSRHVWTKEGVQ